MTGISVEMLSLRKTAFYPFPIGDGTPLDMLTMGELTPEAFAVYAVLHYRSNYGTGYVRDVSMTVGQLAQLSGISKRCAQQALRTLQDVDLLKLTGGRNAHYRFHLTVKFVEEGTRQRVMPCPREHNKGTDYPNAPLARLAAGDLSVRGFCLWMAMNFKSNARKESPLRGHTAMLSRRRLMLLTGMSLGSVKRSLAELLRLELIERLPGPRGSASAFVVYPFITVYRERMEVAEAEALLQQQFMLFMAEAQQRQTAPPVKVVLPPAERTLAELVRDADGWNVVKDENAIGISAHTHGYLKKRGVVYARVGTQLFHLQKDRWYPVSPDGDLEHTRQYAMLKRAFDAGHTRTFETQAALKASQQA